MRLLDSMKTKFVFLEKTEEPDGFGGRSVTWIEGDSFMAAIAKDKSNNAMEAGQHTIAETFTVAADLGTVIHYHDVFKRVADGETFRATTNIQDIQIPGSTRIMVSECTAERWDPVG